MLGVVLKESNKKDQAKEMLIRALNKYPLLWSAWLELSTILDRNDKEVFVRLRDHWAKNFYFSTYYLEIHQEADSIEVNGALNKYFPNSVFLMNQVAQASYHL